MASYLSLIQSFISSLLGIVIIPGFTWAIFFSLTLFVLAIILIVNVIRR